MIILLISLGFSFSFSRILIVRLISVIVVFPPHVMREI